MVEAIGEEGVLTAAGADLFHCLLKQGCFDDERGHERGVAGPGTIARAFA
jgi:hypothetical protein